MKSISQTFGTPIDFVMNGGRHSILDRFVNGGRKCPFRCPKSHDNVVQAARSTILDCDKSLPTTSPDRSALASQWFRFNLINARMNFSVNELIEIKRLSSPWHPDVVQFKARSRQTCYYWTILKNFHHTWLFRTCQDRAIKLRQRYVFHVRAVQIFSYLLSYSRNLC